MHNYHEQHILNKQTIYLQIEAVGFKHTRSLELNKIIWKINQQHYSKQKMGLLKLRLGYKKNIWK